MFANACLIVPLLPWHALFLEGHALFLEEMRVIVSTIITIMYKNGIKKKAKVAYSGTQKLKNNGITVALTTFFSLFPAPSFILGNGKTILLKLYQIIK